MSIFAQTAATIWVNARPAFPGQKAGHRELCRARAQPEGPALLNPLDLLIGPALRQPSRPKDGEVPGSGQPYSPAIAVASALATIIALGWAIKRATAARPRQ